MMLRFASIVCVAAAMASSPTLAQTAKPPTPAQAAQQQRMASCNTEASDRNLKGDARQSYMSACLSGKLNQNTLMKVCNGQATQDKLASDARKTYLSTCLKKSS
jgi:psiF repeat